MERLAQCHRGSLRATTFGEPLLVAICHCKACQRRTGALTASVAGFAEAQVTIEGETKILDQDGQSGRKVRFYFCPNCGTSRILGAYPIYDTEGARLFPGRWNTETSPIIYASEHYSTAMLE